MNAIRGMFQELIGLFVDDVWYAATIAIWLIISAVLSAFSFGDPHYRAIIFSVGLLVILATSVARSASSR